VIRRLYIIGLRACNKYYKNSRFGLAWSRPRADRSVGRPTVSSVQQQVCAKFYPDRLRFGLALIGRQLR